MAERLEKAAATANNASTRDCPAQAGWPHRTA
jgi:hypothetical protein